MTTKTEKVTVAHLVYNYYAKADNHNMTPLELQEGYSKIEIPGEGAEVHQKMDYAIKNKAFKTGLFNVQTISPDQYENAMKFVEGAKHREKDESN